MIISEIFEKVDIAGVLSTNSGQHGLCDKCGANETVWKFNRTENACSVCSSVLPTTSGKLRFNGVLIIEANGRAQAWAEKKERVWENLHGNSYFGPDYLALAFKEGVKRFRDPYLFILHKGNSSLSPNDLRLNHPDSDFIHISGKGSPCDSYHDGPKVSRNEVMRHYQSFGHWSKDAIGPAYRYVEIMEGVKKAWKF